MADFGRRRRRRAGAAGGGWLAVRGSAAPAPAYQLVAAASGTLRQTVSSTGTIEPAQQENLNFAVSGQVTSVAVTVGQKVAAGQVLATVSSASLAAGVAQAKATQASDAAKLSADQAAGSGVTSAQLAADEAAVTAAQSQVADAEGALGQAKLASPIDGVVASVDLSAGQQVSGSGSSGSGSSGSGSSGSGSGGSGGGGSSSAGASSGGSSGSGSGGSSSAQVVVISTGAYVVNGTVDDTEVGLVRAGDQAVIVPDGATTSVYGTVSSVGLIAAITSGVASYPVTIAVTGSPGGLYAGASAAGAGITVTVTVTAATRYLKVVAASSAAFKVGECITAAGQANSIGAVAARTIRISQPGPNGCVTGFGRRGGPGGSPSGAAGNA